MRKFIVNTHPLPGCRKTEDIPVIMEVECEEVSPLEDVSVLFLPKGEVRYRIIKPNYFDEVKEFFSKEGIIKKVMPAVWHSHSFYESREQALSFAKEVVRAQFEFLERK